MSDSGDNSENVVIVDDPDENMCSNAEMCTYIDCRYNHGKNSKQCMLYNNPDSKTPKVLCDDGKNCRNIKCKLLHEGGRIHEDMIQKKEDG